MSHKYRSVSVDKQILVLLSDCEFVYRTHHPEFNLIPLSKSKIMFEVIQFYLKGTDKDLKYRGGSHS